jgi:hypothetical protein
MLFRDDPVLDSLRGRWEEEDERNRRYFDLTHEPGVHGGLSLVPLLVQARRQAQKRRCSERP